MAGRKGETAKLNADINKQLKRRLAVFAKQNDMKIWEVLEMALEPFLDEMEGEKKVQQIEEKQHALV
jgi:predicted oxidoreductase (fatty acid repression mutant protein)